MNPLVLHKDNKTVTTSRLVAGKFGKQHSKVLRDIRNLECSDKFRVSNFGQGAYTHPKNKQEYPECVMTKDGFTFLVMGFTGKEAAKFKEEYITAFNEMESKLRNGNNQLAKADAFLIEQVTKSVLATIQKQQAKNNKLTDLMIRQHEQVADLFLAQQDRLERVEDKLKSVDVKAFTYVQQDVKHATSYIKYWEDVSYLTTRGFAQHTGRNISRENAVMIGKRATQLCKELDLEIRKEPHDTYVEVNAYPFWILSKAYDEITDEPTF